MSFTDSSSPVALTEVHTAGKERRSTALHFRIEMVDFQRSPSQTVNHPSEKLCAKTELNLLLNSPTVPFRKRRSLQSGVQSLDQTLEISLGCKT
jgi:hypothetical protein